MTTAREGTQRTDVDKAFLDNATYRSLGEQELSEREERFEKARRTSGLVLAPLVTIVMLLLPTGLEQSQHRLAAVLLGVVVLWITEAVPIPIGGFIGIAAIVMIGVVPVDDALAPFGSSTVFTFIGAFILAQAMLKHGLAKRFAMFVLGLRGVGSVDDPGDHRLRRDHLPAVGVRLQHRDRGDAAAHRDRPAHRHREADAEQGGRARRLRPAAAAGGRRAHADARVRRQRRRPAHPGRLAAQPDRPRPDRGGDRRDRSPSSTGCCWRCRSAR